MKFLLSERCCVRVKLLLSRGKLLLSERSCCQGEVVVVRVKLLQLDVTSDVEVQQAFEFVSQQVADEGKLISRCESSVISAYYYLPTQPLTRDMS